MQTIEKHLPNILACLPQGTPFQVQQVAPKVALLLRVSGATAYVYSSSGLNRAMRQGINGLQRVDRHTWLYTPSITA
jgi:hypothetical protein